MRRVVRQLALRPRTRATDVPRNHARAAKTPLDFAKIASTRSGLPCHPMRLTSSVLHSRGSVMRAARRVTSLVNERRSPDDAPKIGDGFLTMRGERRYGRACDDALFDVRCRSRAGSPPARDAGDA